MKQALLQTVFTRRVSLATLLCLLVLFVFPARSQACNLSYLQLDSVAPAPGGEWDVYVTACVGAGITGFTKGAAADTYTFAFVFYSSCVPSLGISYFPPSVKGDVTNAAYLGLNYGPVGAPFNAQAAVLYINPSYQPLVCVGSTSACGNVHSQCNQYRFRLSDMPDAIRVLGFEGVGNAMGGCYPDADMMVALPPQGNPCGRTTGGIATPKPFSVAPNLDQAPEHFFTSAAEAAVTDEPVISLYPNPNAGVFALQSNNPAIQKADVTIHDLTGRKVADLREVRMGERIDVGRLTAGSYFLHAQGEGWKTSRMFVVQ